MDALERDFYEERRRKWRRSAFWRGFLVAAVLAAVLAIWLGSAAVEIGTSHVARFEVKGLITDDRRARRTAARAWPSNDSVRAVILRINSPGGTTAGSEALFASLRAIAAREAGRRRARRGRGLGRLRGGDRRRPHRGARQHADRLDRRHHGISGPDQGDEPARDRARDGALLRAQGRALAVPADQPGGARARRGADRRQLPAGSATWSASDATLPAPGSTRWRTAPSSPEGWRWRTA